MTVKNTVAIILTDLHGARDTKTVQPTAVRKVMNGVTALNIARLRENLAALKER